MNTDEKVIAAMLPRYQDALKQSSIDAVMKLYAQMACLCRKTPRHVGAQAVRKAYDAAFDAIKPSVKFDLAEIHQLAPDRAFAGTKSVGRVKVNATGERAAEGNQELFVFQKIAGDWKIARQCFSANPPTLP
jgi:ketosteroid isomerase-like protein